MLTVSDKLGNLPRPSSRLFSPSHTFNGQMGLVGLLIKKAPSARKPFSRARPCLLTAPVLLQQHLTPIFFVFCSLVLIFWVFSSEINCFKTLKPKIAVFFYA